jgi:hypothetical protein
MISGSKGDGNCKGGSGYRIVPVNNIGARIRSPGICQVLSKTFRAMIAAKNFHNFYQGIAASKTRRPLHEESRRDLSWFHRHLGHADDTGGGGIFGRPEIRGAIGLIAMSRLRPKFRRVLDAGTL